MKWFQKTLFLSLILLSFFSLIHCGSSSSGSGSDAPPLDLPSPISHMSITSPNSDGLARVTGEAGATDGNTSVVVTNTTQTSQLKSNMQFALTQTVTSDTDGSFSAEVDAQAGDTVSVTFIINGSSSTNTLTVPETTPPLPSTTVTVSDISYNPTTEEIVVIANDGTDGFLYLTNHNTLVTQTIILNNLGGADRVSVDNTNQIIAILDSTDINNAHHYHIATDTLLSDNTGGNGSSDLAVSPNGGFAILAHFNPTPSMSFYNITTDTITALSDATNGSGSTQATAEWIDINDDGSNEIVLLGSIMDDSNYYLTTHTIDTITPDTTQDKAIAIPNVQNAGGIDLFDQAQFALISDPENDIVYHVTLSSESLGAIDVGDNPQGVSASADNTQGYVVNGNDRTLSTLDFSNQSSTAVSVLGLTPTLIAIDQTGVTDKVFILNTGDNSITIYEP